MGLSKISAMVVLTMMAVAAPAPSAMALTVSVSVSGNSGPWDPIANSGFNYGMHDQASPGVIGTGNGMWFISGDSITIEYLSGTVAVGANYALLNAAV